jgi:membrane-associated phospholipid phosphatase
VGPALKFTVQRERPDGSNDRSFPSGHAAGGFAAATALARHYGWKVAIPAYLGATFIAAARVYDNKHYLSDVTFGAAMGIAGARTVMLKAGRYGVKVAPALTPGGVALGVTVVPAGL